MLFALFWTVITFFSLAGWGRLIHSGKLESAQEQLGSWVIHGIFVCGIVSLFLNFLFPIGPLVSWTFLVLGIAFFSLGLKSFQLLSKPKGLFFYSVLLLLLVTSIAVITPFTTDSGLYHIQYVLWAKQDPLVFGLANVHPRFGLNSIWWLISAIINPLLSIEYATDITNSVLVLAVLVRFIPSNLNSIGSRLGLWFLISIFVFWGKPILFDQLGSPATDLPASFFWLYGIFVFTQDVLKKGMGKQIYGELLIVTILGTMTKTSCLTIGLAIPALFWIRHCGTSQKVAELVSIFRSQRILFFISLVFGLFWMGRTFMLSGCWLYPAVQTCYPRVSWSLPFQDVIDNYRWVLSWARIPMVSPDIVLKDYSWIPKWWNNIYHHPPVHDFLKINLLALVMVALSFRNQFKVIGQQLLKIWPIILWLNFSILFWFKLAPDLRFGSGLFAAIQAIAMSLVFHHSKKWFQKLLGLYLGYLAILLLPFYFQQIAAALEMFPTRKQLSAEKLPKIETQVSRNGVEYRTPTLESQSDQCWLAKRPCTPYPRLDLAEDKFFNFYRMYKSKSL